MDPTVVIEETINKSVENKMIPQCHYVITCNTLPSTCYKMSKKKCWRVIFPPI